MVAVTVRDHDRVEAREVDAERLHVALEDRGVVAGVEQDALPAVLDQRGEAPVPRELRWSAEGVVEDRDADRKSVV